MINEAIISKRSQKFLVVQEVTRNFKINIKLSEPGFYEENIVNGKQQGCLVVENAGQMVSYS